MPFPRRSRVSIYFLALAVFPLLNPVVFGQVAPPIPARPAPGTEAPIQLSVFEVSATDDVGYQAGNTTSGRRLNSSLKDTAGTAR
jgi:hypothetical protein